MAAFQAAVAGSRPVTRSTAGGFQPAGSLFLSERPGERGDGMCAGGPAWIVPGPAPGVGPGD